MPSFDKLKKRISSFGKPDAPAASADKTPAQPTPAPAPALAPALAPAPTASSSAPAPNPAAASNEASSPAAATTTAAPAAAAAAPAAPQAASPAATQIATPAQTKKDQTSTNGTASSAAAAGAASGGAAGSASAGAPLMLTSNGLPDYSEAARSLGAPKAHLRDVYPEIEPFDSGMLEVDPIHTIYWEWSGNPQGVPVVILHGGPGGGVGPGDRRWFDPNHYRVLAFDQRGAGKSIPTAELKDNTTWDLVRDIEKLREKFGVEKWVVFGGSWGSTLSLAYAQTHPGRVLALVLRGIFTLRKSELQFFYQDGSSHIYPEQFEPYLLHIPEKERGDLIKAYYERVTSDDEATRLAAARRWCTWENATSRLYLNHEAIAHGEDDKWALAFARIESHYFYHGGWFSDGALLTRESIDKIRHIPAVIVQGRYDVVCPATTAWELHKQWPEAEFYLVPDAGHSAREPGIAHHLIEATDKLRQITA